jgi:hypothetical protein
MHNLAPALSRCVFTRPAQAVGCTRARTALLARVLAAILPSAPKAPPKNVNMHCA